MQKTNIKPRSLVQEMQESYLDYAMSVIVDRALPDARDGLKPVHRRILITFRDLKLVPGGRFRKSAKICGDVSGNYHPHGEAIVYPSMVHLAQDFKMRYPLVASQGNFGSIDGDPPAAMRYTEAKMSKLAEEMLKDLEKETVDWRDNYDNTRKEPKVLPALLPNLILNGTLGIAVGMASNIPPHNLGEIIDGLIFLIENPTCGIERLTRYIKGPDFPTGGIIYDQEAIKNAYASGRGGVVMQAKTEIVEDKKGDFKIVVQEIPYQVNKTTLIEKIADMVKEKKIEGIRDIRDESDKDGMRMVIILKREVHPKKILNKLFKFTQLQETFHFNMLALVDGVEPKVLNLKSLLEEYLKHRKVVVRRRIEFELKKAQERAHILEGLKYALDHIDAIIKTIRDSSTRETAFQNLRKIFKFTEPQANAILDMRLSQLAGLERQKIETELKEKFAQIKELKAVLKDQARFLQVLKDELKEMKRKYADPRRTQVIPHKLGEYKEEDFIQDEEAIITLTRSGYIKRMDAQVYQTQGRGGKGVRGMKVKDQDWVEHFFSTTNLTRLLFFTHRGRVFQLKAHEIPKAMRTAKGSPIVNFLEIEQKEKITAVISLQAEIHSHDKGDEMAYKFLVMATKKGQIKKIALEELDKVRRSGMIAITLKDSDELSWVKPSTGADKVFLATKKGQAIFFKEKEIRAMGRGAAGVRGIRLSQEDEVCGMEVAYDNEDILIITENGFGKRTNTKKYRLSHRGGKGIKTAKIIARNGQIVAISALPKDGAELDLILISEKGQVIRLPYKQVPRLGRATQGVTIMKFKEKDDRVSSMTCL